MTNDSTPDLARRTFLKTVGLAAGGTALGLGGTGRANAHGGFHTRFANPRVREAAKVWTPRPWRDGYRGRSDRTIAVNDSGLDVRHPDLAPWNEVTMVSEELGDGDGIPEILLANPGALEARNETRTQVGEEHSQNQILGPGTTVEGSETTFEPFEVPTGEGIVDMDAELSWDPQNVETGDPILGWAGEDQSFRVELETPTGDWVTLQTVDTGNNPERLTNVTVVPGARHRFVIGQFANVVADGTVTWQYYTYEDPLSTISEDAIFDVAGFDRTPKTVGWFDAGARNGSHITPADPNGHGSHVGGIIAGSGRASAVDPDRLVEDAPHAVLTAGDVLTYEVEARPGTGVFGVATGEGIEVVLEGPAGRTLRRSGSLPLLDDKEALPIDDARVDHPTVDNRHPTEGGEPHLATYRVYVRPHEGEAVSTGQVEAVAVGAFLPAEETTGDRDGGDVSIHSGLAPDASLVGMQGLSGPSASLGLYADQMGPLFNIRAVNMSWGGLVPGGGTIGGSDVERSIKRIAEGGILTVAAAGNNFGTVNTYPAIADEAVSVTATNYRDGITAYSDGGAQAEDEDGEGFYGKPDICAPGGSLDAGARSVRAESRGVPEGVDAVRDYINLGGTSMATPYVCGVAALVAQAMEEGAPDALHLPAPGVLHDEYTAEERLDHVLRLKAVLLSTATTTAFTAAPYHRHPITYRHDDRDTYEGFGRVNPDAAVDAVTRDLFATATVDDDTMTASVSGAVGLDVPDDGRAIAGYVEVPDGTLDVSLAHSHYAGGNRGMAKGAPWLDLFVYDAETPAANGEPNTLASAMGQDGMASVSLDVSAPRDDPTTAPDESETRALFVVAKLVNVPGVVNGYDVRSHVDLELSFTATGDLPLPAFSASGSRADDGSVFTQGQTNSIEVTVESFSEGVTEVAIEDAVPDGWAVWPAGDAETDERIEGPTTVDLGTVTRDDLDNDAATKRYFVEATGDTGRYTFGEASATIVTADDDAAFLSETDPFGGTDENHIVGVDQNTIS